MADAIAPDVVELHARGAAQWPDVTVELRRFADELGRRLDAGVAPAALHADLYLAIAAADGDATAIAACDRVCAREVEFAARRMGATDTQADDVLAELRRVVFTGEDGRPSALAAFTGRGDLRGYARVIAARAIARRRERDRRHVSLDDEMLDAFAPAIDPELAFLRERYRPEVDAAVRAAIAALPDRARALLRYHLLDHWSIDRIADAYRVHRATAARWLTAARADLGAAIRVDLARRLDIPESQVDSIVALVTSRIELSLDRLLA